MSKDLLELIKLFSEAFGPSGFEDEVRGLLIDTVKEAADSVWIDKYGNVIAVKKGGEPRMLVAAHMDEIGFMIKGVEGNGFLRFVPLGGLLERVLPGQRVIVKTVKGEKVRGVIGCKPPHVMTEEERKKVLEWDKLFIDVGAASKEDVEAMGIRVGCPGCFDREFALLGKGDVFTGKAFDDRLGLAVAVKAFLDADPKEATFILVGTIQEEVGLRGAKLLPFEVEADLAIAVDVTVANDTPGVEERDLVARIGKGVAIKAMDRGLIPHPAALDYLLRVAEEEKIPYQLSIIYGGTTDATAIAYTKDGTPAVVAAIPTRYIHSPIEVASLKDVEAAYKLVRASVEKASKDMLEKLRPRTVK